MPPRRGQGHLHFYNLYMDHRRCCNIHNVYRYFQWHTTHCWPDDDQYEVETSCQTVNNGEECEECVVCHSKYRYALFTFINKFRTRIIHYECGWSTMETGFDYWHRLEIFLYPEVQTGSGAHRFFYSVVRVLKVLFLWVKQSGIEIDHSFLPNARLNSDSFPHMP